MILSRQQDQLASKTTRKKSKSRDAFKDNAKGKVVGVGSITLSSLCDISEVYQVERLKHNLLSISQLCNVGFKLSFNATTCTIRHATKDTTIIGDSIFRLFYANLCISPDNGEMETLVMGSIIINELLCEDVFGAKLFSVVPYMKGVWPDDFEVSLEGAKRAVRERHSDFPVVGPLSLCFEYHILAHIAATTLIPRK
ncbi:hypothetical protein H5410_030518 [Solanum commersonii]|uniref:Uncharacterized protein n=1 Tax=Solanum commersonii TaxID=4109 RepID=A0A9J5YIX4_SOLCO|nr:hypothetical protein H5410_030518 [Solanum commersonii]